jgi:hypothetical protein
MRLEVVALVNRFYRRAFASVENSVSDITPIVCGSNILDEKYIGAYYNKQKQASEVVRVHTTFLKNDGVRFEVIVHP